MPMMSTHYPLGGGLDLKTPAVAMKPGKLTQSQNVEQKVSGGYGRIKGYAKFDSAAIDGEGAILGIWRYGGKVQAFRNATGGVTAEMWESTGSGWGTAKKTGLTPDGTYEFVNYNFAGTWTMYGVSGVHKGFQWDATTWTDITTGVSPDTPEHLLAHKKHLFYNFGHSVQFSATGNPASWTPLTGAGEIAVEDGVTGFMQTSGGALSIYGRNSTNILKGSGASDWDNVALTEHGKRVGAIPGTIQQLGSMIVYLDDRGLTTLTTTLNFGDFKDASVSYDVNDFLLTKKNDVTCSCVVKDKSQYRIFFTDGTGMIFTFVNNKLAGATRIAFDDVVRCVVSTEDDNGDEIILFGSDDGYIYQMETGNSFDGVAMEAYMRLAYNHMGNPRNRKRFRRANLDMYAQGSVTVQVKPDFKFESTGIVPPPDYTDIVTAGIGAALGDSDELLGTVLLGGSVIIEGGVDMPGHGGYVSLFFYSNAIEAAWEIDGITYDYIPGRGRRGRA